MLNPKHFLMLGGVVLVLLGVAGMFVLGPSVESSMLGEKFFLTEGENIAHLVLGAVALGAYFTIKSAKLLRLLVLVVGVVAVVAVIWGLVSMGKPNPNIGVANLENPADNILHALVAVWALVTLVKKSA